MSDLCVFLKPHTQPILFCSVILSIGKAGQQASGVAGWIDHRSARPSVHMGTRISQEVEMSSMAQDSIRRQYFSLE